MRASLRLVPGILLGALLAVGNVAAAGPPPMPPDSTDHPLNINSKDLHWDKMLPDLGEGSPTISVVHKDAKTGATQILVRVPKDFHVTPHWHSANETHT